METREVENIFDKLNLNETDYQIKFGEGLLMTMFLQNESEEGLVIAKHGEETEAGELIGIDRAERLSQSSVPLTLLTFPENQAGLKSLDSLSAWLDILERNIKGTRIDNDLMFDTMWTIETHKAINQLKLKK
ncbi:hypothetical protein [Vagococcus carniphilus]|uniref:Uncharacterized protein n=1 Tax=Vagococcus carniphilus TaxID=218144 RepID=A0A430B688_9ENTE|nr:hypothetical protein [Vagococcus carniphilus]QNN72712.1 hypothetical protein H9L18_12750 [Vagococcus carniphilus]RSU15819.1 hypothetical protein CBF28_05125 [Vagococcus carniphilus]